MIEEKEKVIIRRWKAKPHGFIFLFPETPFDYEGGQCESWEPVGQHGGADYHGVIAMTKPVSPHSWEAENELRKYEAHYPGAKGQYKIVAKATYADHEKRRNRAFQIRHKAEHGT